MNTKDYIENQPVADMNEYEMKATIIALRHDLHEAQLGTKGLKVGLCLMVAMCVLLTFCLLF